MSDRVPPCTATRDPWLREAVGVYLLGALEPEWSSLIRCALGDRADQWGQVHQPADERAVGRTLAFVDYALRAARRAVTPPSPEPGSPPSARR